MKPFYVGLIVSLSMALSSPLLVAAPANGYKLVQSYTLGGEGGWDSITFDNSTRRLYLSHTAHVNVVNADTGAVVGDVSGLSLAHGVVLVKDLNRGFISDGGQDKVVIFNLRSLKVLREVKTGGNPDCIIFDPASKHIFTFNGRTQDSTVISPASGSVIATIPMGGRPEYAVADGKGMIYINIRDKNEVAMLDSHALVIKARWPITPAAMPTAITMDRQNRRLFIGGRNQVLAIMDANNGKIVQTFPIGFGVDTNIYDPMRHLLFVSAREGTIHIFHEDSSDKFSQVDTVKTQPGAHTMALDAKSGNLFLDTADFEPGQTPKSTPSTPLPNVFDHSEGGFHAMGVARGETFRLLVYGK